ncbi:MAG: hypothetical protein J6X18_07450 [Bacteroidales bacterium]|nr:hypothetical protein [Bacteroidales bacterium]
MSAAKRHTIRDISTAGTAGIHAFGDSRLYPAQTRTASGVVELGSPQL